jgi:hypothetical protein
MLKRMEHQGFKRTQGRILIGILSLLCVGGSFWLLQSLISSPKFAEQPVLTRIHYPDLVEHRLAVNKVPTLTAEELPAFDTALSDAIDRGVAIVEAAVAGFDPNAPIDARRPDPPASGPALESLRRTLVEHVRAITADKNESYLALADGEPTRWIGPGARSWNAIDSVMRYNWKRTGRRDDARGELAVMLDRFWFGPEGNRFVGMATDEDGMVVLSGTTRIAADVTRPMMYELLEPERYEWFRFPGYRAIRTREAVMTPRDIIRRDGYVEYAQTVVVLRTADGNTGQWWATWFYDPLRDRWLNKDSGLRSGWRNMAWFY